MYMYTLYEYSANPASNMLLRMLSRKGVSPVTKCFVRRVNRLGDADLSELAQVALNDRTCK